MDKKTKLKVLHWILFWEGDLEGAHMVLRLLRKGVINLGLDDASAKVEVELDRLGFSPRYSREFRVATYRVEV